MTSNPTGREDDDRLAPAAATTDDERPIDDDDDEEFADQLDLPIETPAADAIDQRHAEHFDDDFE